MSLKGRFAVVRRFGGPEVIAIEEHEVGPLGPGQVCVAVRTGGLNPVDARRRSGSFGGSVPMLLGSEFAGIVLESQDSRWTPGTEVIGWGANGADADLVTTVGDQLHAKPADLDWGLAGGLSGVGQTALTALEEVPLTAGELMVIHGASGGVGTVLTQLAVARGIRVLATASPSNADHLRALGALPVAYGPGLSERLAQESAAIGAPIAASIDLAGTAEAGDVAREVLARGGQAVTLVPETMTSHGLRLVQVRRSAERMGTLLEAVSAGQLDLPVEAIPFVQIIAAHEQLDSRHARGKVVLDLSDNPHLAAAAAAPAGA